MQVQKIELTGLGFGGDFAAEESYKTLLSNIQFCGGDVKLISITSCFPNEGKTTISIELSRELAETLSFAELCDFFGSFADERIAPSGLCEPTAYDNSTAEKIIVGAIKTDAGGLVRAEKFVFTIENGVVTDVEGED